ncbi:MAG: 16S rRNA (guanine(527)-N(7))-methyltransferase RsmG [Bacteroidetes bacterium]|nr:MAG: 16S rRNA (guanine(527)-N(7))-methyltransferase RsmG [Bacteroidota bacterium]
MDFVPGTEIVFRYFPDLNAHQKDQFHALGDLYAYWNRRINVISRKDIHSIYQNHVLHSLGIAKIQEFRAVDKILDVGTGGGFPGIPLAILFPYAHFHCIDSIGKKIKVVKEVIHQLGLTNASCEQIRAEQLKDRYDFIVSRAVTRLNRFIPWVKANMLLDGQILYLKGGDLREEINEITAQVEVYQLADFFRETFFETKKVLKIKGL